ncbi:hypothetical protein [Methylophilus sp. YYY-1]|uniref:hypothetical protein n=1 Tax=Methylophilus sp. YYY-1 TaxID=2682087 RepID=UPI0023B211AD|nr:hypothetical protein [Methylophilus sp. YYY-1]MDF0376837.1 hypothetical protein [Methylophilus sp. YYY-1]
MRSILFLVVVCCISRMILCPSISLAQQQIEADNWCTQAEDNLTDKDGNSVSCKEVGKRCIRMNNYWCQKQGDSPWLGTSGKNGKDGNRDVDGHAIFETVEWSARAIAIDLRSKYRRGFISAVQIAAAYSPWCDTLGSKAVVKGSGRTCLDKRAMPPPGFSGPLCKQPDVTKASRTKSCLAGCNCPPQIAETLVRGLQPDINADLMLFDSKGNPLPNLGVVIRNLAIQEQGVYIKQNVIEAGIAKLINKK